MFARASRRVPALHATRRDATTVFPVPGPPLITSTPGGAGDQGRRRRVGTFPHPFGPPLRA